MANMQDLMSGDPARDKMIATFLKDDEFAFYNIAPRVGVPLRNGSVGVMGPADKITNNSDRADIEAAPEVNDLVITEQTYNCKSIDRKKSIPNGELNHTKYNPDIIRMGYSESLTTQIKLIREKRLMDKITNTSNYASTNKVTVGSNDKFTNSSAKPTEYIRNKASDMFKATGVKADSILFSWVSLIAYLSNPNVEAQLPSINYGIANLIDVFPLLKGLALDGLKNIYVASATFDKNAKKDARDGDFLWSDDVILFKKAEPIEGSQGTDGKSQIVKAGFLVSVESEDPEDFGSYEDKPKDKKVTVLENRYSFDLLNCGSNTATFDYGYLIHDTNA